MTDTTTGAMARADIMRFVKANIRDYALLLSLLAIMVFFQFTTNGTLFMPVNMTNIILQNSYIVTSTCRSARYRASSVPSRPS
jgi:putative multiple sugar transport system permease protein